MAKAMEKHYGLRARASTIRRLLGRIGLVWRRGERKNTALLIERLEHLRASYRGARRIVLILAHLRHVFAELPKATT